MALPPITPVQAAISGGQTLVQLISAMKQAAEAKKLARTPRPQYNIPGQITEATEMARMAYLDPTLPGQSAIEENIKAGTAGSVNQARNVSGSSSDLLSMIGGLNKQQGQQFNQLGVQGAQQQNTDRQALSGALGKEAGFADKAFGWNEQQPYMDAMKAAAALKESSSRNLFNAVSGGGAIVNSLDQKSLFGDGAKSLLPKERQGEIAEKLGGLAGAAAAIGAAGKPVTVGDPTANASSFPGAFDSGLATTDPTNELLDSLDNYKAPTTPGATNQDASFLNDPSMVGATQLGQPNEINTWGKPNFSMSDPNAYMKQQLTANPTQTTTTAPIGNRNPVNTFNPMFPTGVDLSPMGAGTPTDKFGGVDPEIFKILGIDPNSPEAMAIIQKYYQK